MQYLFQQYMYCVLHYWFLVKSKQIMFESFSVFSEKLVKSKTNTRHCTCSRGVSPIYRSLSACLQNSGQGNVSVVQNTIYIVF